MSDTLAFYVAILAIGVCIDWEVDSAWLYYRDRRGSRRALRYWGA